jgi:hypothetical protein
MTKQVTLQELINKVKQDLFTPYQGTDKEGKIIYPIFFVDNVELEVTVNLTYDAEAGLKITIPQIAEGSVTGGQGKETGHKMKISLLPIMTRDEMRDMAKKDDMLWRGIETATAMSLRKGSTLAGEEE